MAAETIGNVYLLHFETKVHGRQHYVGFTRQTVDERVASHRDGSGSQLSSLAVKQGVPILLAKRWENVPVSFEKQLKREKNLKRHCFVCQVEAEHEATLRRNEDWARQVDAARASTEAAGPVPPQAG